MKIGIINGPNLNLLGSREPQIYGTTPLEELNEGLKTFGQSLNMSLSFFQSNHEGELIDHIHSLRGAVDGLVVNAGAFTHTSLALKDALAATEIPFIEVHLSNIYAREAYRHHSYLSSMARGCICGF